MTAEQFKQRTKSFALNVIRETQSLRRTPASDIIIRQLIRSATSVGANYRAACRSQTPKVFVSKMSIVEEETDESLFWLELLEELGGQSEGSLLQLKQEATEILSMTVASIRTARFNLKHAVSVSPSGKT